MLKGYGHVVRMEDNTKPGRIMTWLPGERRRRGRPEVKWVNEVERVMKQKTLTPDDVTNRQLWRL
jgi:hypothetical protein